LLLFFFMDWGEGFWLRVGNACARFLNNSLKQHQPQHQPTHPAKIQTKKPAYLLIPITGVILGCSNLFGYFKCSKEAKRSLQSAAASVSANVISAAMQSRLQAAIARV
jgi:hypothetical protein